MTTRRMLRRVVCAMGVAVATFAAGCGTPTIEEGDKTAIVGQCRVQREAVATAGTDIGAQLSSGVWGGGVQVSDERVKQISTYFDTIQRDYDLKSAKLCDDLESGRVDMAEYARLRSCQDQAHDAQRTLDTMLAAIASGNVPATRADWLLESQMSHLHEASRCAPAPTGAIEALPDQVPPRTKGRLHVAAPVTADPVPIGLLAHLICQRRQPDGRYADVPRCNHATLTEGDRVKFAFETDQDARAYLFLYNDAGQFQMLFPAPGIDNETVAGERYVLPPGEAWFELDDVAGVTEYVHLVASPFKVAELEALRGQDIAPGEQREVALRTRGLVEPVLSRGFDMSAVQEKPLMLSPNAQVSTVPVDVEALDVVGVEFEIRHE